MFVYMYVYIQIHKGPTQETSICVYTYIHTYIYMNTYIV